MWFEIAITAILLLVGQILFGHFEERTPRWRILAKHALGIIVYTAIAYFFGRFWFYLSIAVTLAPLLIIHVWWLPKHGVNGWTGEPKEKYYALRGWKL